RQAEYDKLPKDDKKARATFFGRWTQKEAEDAGATGVFVLICKSPGHVHFVIDRKTREAGKFTNDQGDEMVKGMLDKFKEGKDKPEADATAIRDKALEEAVQFVQDTLKGKKK